MTHVQVYAFLQDAKKQNTGYTKRQLFHLVHISPAIFIKYQPQQSYQI